MLSILVSIFAFFVYLVHLFFDVLHIHNAEDLYQKTLVLSKILQHLQLF